MPETCPQWCDGVQYKETNPGDRYHQRVIFLPLVHRVFDPSIGSIHAVAVEGSVALFTSATREDEVWISVDLGEDGRGITISAESAERVSRALTDTLGACRMSTTG